MKTLLGAPARVGFLSLGCVSLLLVGGCRFPTSGSYPIRAHTESIQLLWDPPVQQWLPPGQGLALYHVYFRIHGTANWTLLGVVPATDTPGVTINRSNFGRGEYDFAVDSVTADGRESDLHFSFDASANPLGGWYLVWN